MNRRGWSAAVACVVLTGLTLPAPHALAQSWKDAIDYTKLQSRLGSATPIGAGGMISLVEAPQVAVGAPLGSPANAYYIDVSQPEFSAGLDPTGAGVTLTDGSFNAANGISSHAQNTVGGSYFGNTLSIAPGANNVTIYEANHWLSSVLKYTSMVVPLAQNFRVQNHSWVGTIGAGATTQDQAVLRRLDYLIETGEMTSVVGANNSSPSMLKAHPNLLAHSYNSIVVGRTDGGHSRGQTNSVYGPGRHRPDIVVPTTSTSNASARVSSVAAMLHEAIAGTDAARSETMKALLLAGATKQEFAAWVDPTTGLLNPWDHTPTRPLDDVFGAGEINVYNSYLIQLGGKQAGSTAAPATAVGSYGWDYQNRKGDAAVGDLFYSFEVTEGSSAQELSIILTWNAKVTDLNPSASFFSPMESLQNLDLQFYDSSNGFLGALIDESISNVDNVEHLYLTDLGPGIYTVKVSGAANWDYGLAWRMSTLFDELSADFDENGVVSGADFLAWQRNFGKLVGATHADGDADGDGDVDTDDLSAFQAGAIAANSSSSARVATAVPEPSMLASVVIGSALLAAVRRRRRSQFCEASCTKRLAAAGFTLVELLVAIAIIGALIALLLPALPAAREAARRTQCGSNQRQVALGVLNYENANSTLPAAGAFPPASEALYFKSAYLRINLRTGSMHSWVTRILPYLEQSQLYSQFDFLRHVAASPGAPQATQPALLLCPSDDAWGRMYQYQDSSGNSIPFAKANYAGFASPYHVDGYDSPGAIWLYGTKLKSVTDGLTNTLMLGEVRTREHERDQRGAWALPWAGSTLLSVDMHPLADRKSATDQAAPYQYNPHSLGATQPPNSPRPDVLYDCPDEVGEQVEAMPCTTDFGIQRYISAAPRSSHPGGVNTAYLDGSVHFLSDDVDEIAMAYLAAIDDGVLNALP